MQQARQTLEAVEIQVVVVTFEPPAVARAYVQETGCPWPLLVDTARTLYRGYGMGRANLRHLWGPSTVVAYMKELGHSRLPRWPVADTGQQGGDVLIDAAGMVRFVHVGTGPGDRPPVDQLLAARRRADHR